MYYIFTTNSSLLQMFSVYQQILLINTDFFKIKQTITLTRDKHRSLKCLEIYETL